jgi:hypothetical protein
MQALRQAYQVLIDPKTRHKYDVSGLGGLGPKVDAALFRKQPVDGADLFLRTLLPFDTAAFGGAHRIECQRKLCCQACQVCMIPHLYCMLGLAHSLCVERNENAASSYLHPSKSCYVQSVLLASNPCLE